MNETTNGSRQAETAAENLGPEESIIFSALDPIGFGSAVARVGLALAQNPSAGFAAWSKFATDLALAGAATTARLLGGETSGPIAPAPKDRRFVDPTWTSNPAYFFLLQGYLLSARLIEELVETANVDPQTTVKAQFAVRQVIDAMAPTNTMLNPAVLKRTLETGGVNLLRGLRSFLIDVAQNGGLPQQVDRSTFVVGKNLAATPGKVVLRNELMELIQYEPQTETVYEVPLLCSPPWINKYYVMDLAPNRSFIEWAVQHGHTVFAISYRNPDATMRGVGLDDYLLHGPHAALDAIEQITGSTATNIAALCLGGTLTTFLLAWLAQNEPERVNSATLLNTIVDFSQPGVLGAFTDEATVSKLERQMAERGVLDSRQMATTFTMLRPNDLIWNYAVNNWLLGESPPAFDILAWNADATRMPAAMHTFYLRSCYLRNDFVQGRMELAGQRLDPDSITHDLYVLNAIDDHITVWRGGYATTQKLANAKPRFVLSTSGHIAGIVNPPSPKSAYWTNDEPPLPPDPDRWLAGARKHTGSWWEDWAAWIAERGGRQRTPPMLGSDAHPQLGDAPGTYVHGA